jgi:hypothetical protein
MALEAERMQILKMLEEDKITAEEAAQLLAALNVGAEKEQPRPETPPAGQKKRRVRICVTDKASGKHPGNGDFFPDSFKICVSFLSR